MHKNRRWIMYNSANVAERIKIIAKARNISIKQLMEEVGLGFNTMANMKTSMPKSDNLAKIADRLNCSVDYLLGRTDNPTIEKIIVSQDDSSPDNKLSTVTSVFNKLDPIDQAKLLVYADELRNKE